MKKIAQVLDAMNKTRAAAPPTGGTQVTPEVALQQRGSAKARANARMVRKPKCA
jgi:hypothetical protein